MSLQTLVGISMPNWNIAELVTSIHVALSDCTSVKGMYSVQRLSGDSYVDLQRDEILSAPEGRYVDDSSLKKIAGKINESTQGLEVRWEVERFKAVSYTHLTLPTKA